MFSVLTFKVNHSVRVWGVLVQGLDPSPSLPLHSAPPPGHVTVQGNAPPPTRSNHPKDVSDA